MGMLSSLVLVLFVVCSFAAQIPGTYGYIETDPSINGKLFYWFFESNDKPDTDPLVIWLNGGPGCSSMMGLLTENGPFHVDMKTGQTYNNPFGWNTHATYMAFDQPYGVGFSVADKDIVENDDEVATEMLAFIQNFYAKYPKFANVDLYVTGESFGGHYVPAVSSAIVKHNKQVAAGLKDGVHIPLKGMAIGNGWTAPSYQYAYQDFAYANKLIDSETYRHLNTTYKYCRDLINDGHYLLANTICQSIFSDILRLNPGLNYYDIKLPCVGSLCFDFSKVDAFLNDPANQKTLGVDVDFTECTDSINIKWSISDRIKNYEPNVRTVLDAGHRVLFYNGDDDLICNWIGTQQALVGTFGLPQSLNTWTNTKYPGGASPAGWCNSKDNLTFCRVSTASHMVPMSQPQNALDMIERFLSNTPFN